MYDKRKCACTIEWLNLANKCTAQFFKNTLGFMTIVDCRINRSLDLILPLYLWLPISKQHLLTFTHPWVIQTSGKHRFPNYFHKVNIFLSVPCMSKIVFLFLCLSHFFRIPASGFRYVATNACSWLNSICLI